MEELENKIKKSKCFSLYHSDTSRSCYLCEVSNLCKEKCTMKPPALHLADPSEVSFTKESHDKSRTKEFGKSKRLNDVLKEKNNKFIISPASEMPAFKELTLEELENLAKSKGIDLSDFDRYNKNQGIRRMHLTSAMKKLYVGE